MGAAKRLSGTLRRRQRPFRVSRVFFAAAKIYPKTKPRKPRKPCNSSVRSGAGLGGSWSKNLQNPAGYSDVNPQISGVSGDLEPPDFPDVLELD